MKLKHCHKAAFLIFKVVVLVSIYSGTIKAATSPSQIKLIIDSSYEPYSYIKNGKLVGITVDLMNQVNKALPDYDIELYAMEWRDGLSMVRDGKALGIVGTYFSGPHRPWIYPYSQPLLAEKVVVICRPDLQLPQPVIWPDSFAGSLVLNIAGYDGWLDFDIRNKRNTQLVNFLEVPATSIAYKMLKNGNADCSLSEYSFAQMAIENESENAKNKPVIVTEVTSNTVHLGFSVEAIKSGEYPNALDFARAFDIALYQVKHSK